MPIPKIETHLTQTPLKANPGYDYSLGILYITRDEARKIAEFIQIIERERITEKAYMPASAMIGGTAGPANWQDDLREKAKGAGLIYTSSMTYDIPGTVQYYPDENTSKMWTGREWLPVEAIGELVRRRRDGANNAEIEAALKAAVINASDASDVDRYVAMQLKLTPEQRQSIKDAIVNRGIAVDKSEEPEQIAAPSNRFSELDIE